MSKYKNNGKKVNVTNVNNSIISFSKRERQKALEALEKAKSLNREVVFMSPDYSSTMANLKNLDRNDYIRVLKIKEDEV